MKRILILMLLAMVFAAPAWAAKIIGNGGDVSVCPNQTPRVQLLDFVESRVLRKRTITLWNPPGNTYLEKLDNLIAKLDKRFPVLAAVIRKEVANFEEKNVKENNIELEDINDSYHKLRLPGCHVEQIANQSIPMFDDDPWFLINANLWSQLEEVDKAGLVLHEVLYRIGLKHGLEHSIGIRYLVSLLFQEKLETVSDKQWIQAFMHSRVQSYETSGLRFNLFRGDEKVCEVVPGTIECAGGDAVIKPAVISFTPDRQVRRVTVDEGQDIFEFRFDGFTASLQTNKVSFEWFANGTAEFTSEGRLKLSKGSVMDVLLADVRGKFNPLTGLFVGEYKLIRTDSPIDENWRPFNSNLSTIYNEQLGPPPGYAPPYTRR